MHLSVPQDHLRLLDMYEKVVEYLMPEDERLIRPVIFHRNSHWGNIFLSQEALSRDGTIEISAVTDWQHTRVLPLYLTADFPRFIKELEQGPDQEDEAFSKEVAILRECYHALYRDAGYNLAWAAAIPYGTNTSMSRYLPDAASRCWHGGQVILKRELIRAAQNWEKIAGPDVTCPLGPSPFSEEEIALAEGEQRAWEEADHILRDMSNNIGVKPVDGWVGAENHDCALRESGTLRDIWVEVWKESIAKDEKNRLPRELNPADLWPFEVAAPGEAASKQ